MVLFDEEKERAIAVLQDMALLARKEDYAREAEKHVSGYRPVEHFGPQAAYKYRQRLKYEGAQLALSAVYGPNITTLMIQEAERRAAKVR